MTLVLWLFWFSKLLGVIPNHLITFSGLSQILVVWKFFDLSNSYPPHSPAQPSAEIPAMCPVCLSVHLWSVHHPQPVCLLVCPYLVFLSNIMCCIVNHIGKSPLHLRYSVTISVSVRFMLYHSPAALLLQDASETRIWTAGRDSAVCCFRWARGAADLTVWAKSTQEIDINKRQSIATGIAS